jgi:hypothetical protein
LPYDKYLKEGQGKNYRLLQSVMCGVISFATTGRILSATGKYYGKVGIHLPNCTVLNSK